MKFRIAQSAAALGTVLCAGASASRAQTPAEFYAGKTVEIVVGSSPGAGYDIYARLLSRHIGSFIPGHPNIVVRNMDGAGGLRVPIWLQGAAHRKYFRANETSVGLGRRVCSRPRTSSDLTARIRVH